jgi:predicted nucleic acid-binding protein
MSYLLDANVFIEAKRRYYGFDFCPAFWDWLIEAGSRNLVFSVEKVRDELILGGDDLAEWARKLNDMFFLSPDGGTIRSLAAALEWARGESFRQGAISSFADDADAYLVAHAHAHNHIVVTHELPSDAIKQVKIPNVCVALKVKYVNTFEMLRREKALFVLGRRR